MVVRQQKKIPLSGQWAGSLAGNHHLRMWLINIGKSGGLWGVQGIKSKVLNEILPPPCNMSKSRLEGQLQQRCPKKYTPPDKDHYKLSEYLVIKNTVQSSSKPHLIWQIRTDLTIPARLPKELFCDQGQQVLIPEGCTASMVQKLKNTGKLYLCGTHP